jgi:hypothetical protein
MIGAAEKRGPIQIARGVTDQPSARISPVYAAGKTVGYRLVTGLIDLKHRSPAVTATPLRRTIQVASRVTNEACNRILAIPLLCC